MAEVAGFEAPGLHVVQLEGGLTMAGSPLSYSICPFVQVCLHLSQLTIEVESGGCQNK
jgi:hypothetical protein